MVVLRTFSFQCVSLWPLHDVLKSLRWFPLQHSCHNDINFLAWISVVQFIAVLSFINWEGREISSPVILFAVWLLRCRRWLLYFFSASPEPARRPNERRGERDVLRLHTVNYRHNRVSLCIYNYSLCLSSQAVSLCGLHLKPHPPLMTHQHWNNL